MRIIPKKTKVSTEFFSGVSLSDILVGAVGVVLLFFVIVSTIAGILTWEAWYSFLPSVAMILTTISYWLKSETKIRLVTFPSSPCWLVYNIIVGSVAGIVTECIVMSSLIIAIIRYDILKKGKVNKNEN
jgi:hypothetical protein